MNPVYRVVLQQAKKMISNPKKTQKTVERAIKKSGKTIDGKKGNVLVQLKTNLNLFIAMMGDYVKGNYKNLPLKTAIKILGALLYFVLLVDLIPDFFAVIGLTDDAAVLAWVINSVSKDIKKYKDWKDENEGNITQDSTELEVK